jgi:hypothetical protein
MDDGRAGRNKAAINGAAMLAVTFSGASADIPGCPRTQTHACAAVASGAAYVARPSPVVLRWPCHRDDENRHALPAFDTPRSGPPTD